MKSSMIVEYLGKLDRVLLQNEDEKRKEKKDSSSFEEVARFVKSDQIFPFNLR